MHTKYCTLRSISEQILKFISLSGFEVLYSHTLCFIAIHSLIYTVVYTHL